jgi:hypothetical protein
METPTAPSWKHGSAFAGVARFLPRDAREKLVLPRSKSHFLVDY